MSDWGKKTGTIGYSEWYRSYRQDCITTLGEIPHMSVNVEKVKVLEDGAVIHEDAGTIVFDMGSLSGEDLQDAIAIQSHMTSLIERRLKCAQIIEPTLSQDSPLDSPSPSPLVEESSDGTPTIPGEETPSDGEPLPEPSQG